MCNIVHDYLFIYYELKTWLKNHIILYNNLFKVITYFKKLIYFSIFILVH